MKPRPYNDNFCPIDAADTCRYIICTSLLFVSTAGREAGYLGRLPHFATRTKTTESAERQLRPQPGHKSPTSGANPSAPNKQRPVSAGRCTGDTMPGGVKEKKGVFGAGALLPQFLAELTITLNSHIWDYHSISARSWQA